MTRMRQLVDWSAALWAGLLAGTIYLAVLVFVLPRFVEGNAWAMVRLLASIVLGEGILAPPATYDLGALVAGVGAHYLLSILFALLVATVLHRYGMVIGVLGGAVFGLALFAINAYGMTAVLPNFMVMQSLPFLLAHLLFGALAGGIYEMLEVEEFELVEAAAEAN